ncbi:1-aminocyclopropane-1-carboxylate deaminase [Rhodotorula toruloides]|uniref:1-aminocyclopropane-1-carboxylate deaminase n=1 Tax=Rhodotorula toruloides TaxID=5286 RepID=A0A511KQ55_RHOTO|nr:1-aminocyclopropane-1-carboxylate deaminase [Rhodotorula toruloides]
MSHQLAILQKWVGVRWSDVAPRPWEHFRSTCQDVLRHLHNGATSESLLLKRLTLVEVFGIGDYAEARSFGAGGSIEPDDRSSACFAALHDAARKLQQRYSEAGYAQAGYPDVDMPDAPFWFLQLPDYPEGALTAGRLRLLSHGAQDALVEHVEYIAQLKPLPCMAELPGSTQLLVNAELGACYIKIKEAISACRPQPNVNRQYEEEINAEYEEYINFPAITKLPLELIFELTSALEDAAKRGEHKPTLSNLFGTAIVKIYEEHVDAVVCRLLRTLVRLKDAQKWKEEYLRPLNGWKGAGWSPSGHAAEWAELQRVENELIAGTHIPLEHLPKQALAYRYRGEPYSLAHGYVRISHRMARRIGTSREAWEAERASREF